MSKQSDAKTAQGYVIKAIPKTCANCSKFSTDIHNEYSSYTGKTHPRESNLRCGIGNFAVKKNSTCDMFESK